MVPSYDQLATCQWMLGFLKIHQEEQDATIRENMVEYLTELLQDACNYSWESAKGAHNVLLHWMQGDVVNWSNLKEVNKILKQYAQTSSAFHGAAGERSITKVVSCFKYNKCSSILIMSGRTCYSNRVANIVSLLSIDMKCIPKNNAQKLQKNYQSCSWFHC